MKRGKFNQNTTRNILTPIEIGKINKKINNKLWNGEGIDLRQIRFPSPRWESLISVRAFRNNFHVSTQTQNTPCTGQNQDIESNKTQI
jgi:hypothetical protein